MATSPATKALGGWFPRWIKVVLALFCGIVVPRDQILYNRHTGEFRAPATPLANSA